MTKKNGTGKAAVRERNALFVKAYLACGENATEAYLAVKPHVARNTAGAEGHKLLKLPEIQKAIEKHRAEQRVKFSLTSDRAMQELARVAYFDSRKVVKEDGEGKRLHEIDEDTAAGLTVELDGAGKVLRVRTVRPSEKNAAIEKAAKILRLYDRPPPPPPDDTGEQRQADPRETARRMAFLLARGAAADREQPKPAAKPRKKLALPA